MPVSFAFETAKDATGCSCTPSIGSDWLGWPILNRRRAIENSPFEVEQRYCVALFTMAWRPKVAIEFFSRNSPVHTERDIVGVFSDGEL
jgi:hypothetical protein